MWLPLTSLASLWLPWTGSLRIWLICQKIHFNSNKIALQIESKLSSIIIWIRLQDRSPNSIARDRPATADQLADQLSRRSIGPIPICSTYSDWVPTRQSSSQRVRARKWNRHQCRVLKSRTTVEFQESLLADQLGEGLKVIHCIIGRLFSVWHRNSLPFLARKTHESAHDPVRL